jgi:hypothetical protein
MSKHYETLEEAKKAAKELGYPVFEADYTGVPKIGESSFTDGLHYAVPEDDWDLDDFRTQSEYTEIKTIAAPTVVSKAGLIDAYLTAWKARKSLTEAQQAGIIGSTERFTDEELYRAYREAERISDSEMNPLCLIELKRDEELYFDPDQSATDYPYMLRRVESRPRRQEEVCYTPMSKGMVSAWRDDQAW